MKQIYILKTILFLTFLSLNAQTVSINNTNCIPSDDDAMVNSLLDQIYTYQGNLNGASPNFAGLSGIWKYWLSNDGINVIVSDDKGNFVLTHIMSGSIYYTATGVTFGDPPPSAYWTEGSGLYCNNLDIIVSGDTEDPGTLSISDINLESSKIKLHPNPSKDFIQLFGITNIENYSIYNIIGSEIKKGMISNNERVDIQDLSLGLYLLKFENGNTVKFIKR